MSLRTTLVLFVISLSLGIYISFFERNQSTQVTQTDTARVLARFDPADISQIEIRHKSWNVTLNRTETSWRFEDPITDRADPKAINTLLDLLSHLTVRDEIKASELGGEDLNDKALGFDGRHALSVKLSGAGELPPVELRVGTTAPLSNTIYARPSGTDNKDKSTYVVDGNPRQYLEDPIASLRDRNLLDSPAELIVRIGIRTADSEIELRRKITPPVTGWTLTKPLQTRANADLVDNLISRLKSLKVEEFLDRSAGPVRKQEIPEKGAVIDIQLFGVEKPLQLILSPAPEEAPGTDDAVPDAPLLTAELSDREGVFRVRSALLESLPSGPNLFRDPYLARIEPQWLKSIIIESRVHPRVVLVQDGQRWYSHRNAKKENANLERVERLIRAFNEEKILSFVSDSVSDLEPFGLDQPFLKLAFISDTPQPESKKAEEPSQTTPGAGEVQSVLQFGRKEVTDLYVNYVGQPYVYSLDPTFLNTNVPTHPLKWKSLRILNFNEFSLRGMARRRPDTPNVDLVYDYTRNSWEGRQGDEDISSRLDGRALSELSRLLGSFTIEDWVLSDGEAMQSLTTPALEIDVTLEEIDPAINEPRPVTHTLRFAPAGTGTATRSNYYGQIDGSPDVFLISWETFGQLIRPITKVSAQPPAAAR